MVASDNLIIATKFAERIAACKSEQELSFLRKEIQEHLEKDELFKLEWKEWLNDIKTSKLIELGVIKI